jgi:hypothetical protein
MKYDYILKLSSLYLTAALKIPDWMPDWVKNDKNIKTSPEKYMKRMPIESFEEETSITKTIPSEHNEFADNIWYEICKLNDLALSLIDERIIGETNLSKIDNLIDIFRDLNKTNINKSITDNIILNDLGVGNKIRVQKGQKFTSFYLLLKKVSDSIPQLANTLPPLENIKGFKKYSPSKILREKLYIIFSTDPIDLLGMSVRSTWTSCQNIFNGRYKEQAIGTALSSNIGIIYLTDKKDFEGRGFKMINRALVKVIYDSELDKAAIYIDRCYPSDSESINNLFKDAIKKHTNLDVYSYNEGNVNNFYIKDEFTDIEADIAEPYNDTPFNDKSIRKPNYGKTASDFINGLPNLNDDNIHGILAWALDNVNWITVTKNPIYINNKSRAENYLHRIKLENIYLKNFIKRIKDAFGEEYGEIISDFKDLINDRKGRRNATIFYNLLNGNDKLNESLFSSTYQTKIPRSNDDIIL